jgi:hypothetical protein
MAPLAQVPKGLVFLACVALNLVMLQTDLFMFHLDGPAWSLRPRDGLYATSGNLAQYHLPLQLYSSVLKLSAIQFCNAIVKLSPSVADTFPLYTPQYHNGDT